MALSWENMPKGRLRQFLSFTVKTEAKGAMSVASLDRQPLSCFLISADVPCLIAIDL